VISAARPSIMMRLKSWIFQKLIDRIDDGLAWGTIEAILPDGSFRILGGRGPGPVAHLTIHRWRALLRLVRAGSVGGYEGWEKWEWSSPDLVALFDLFLSNRATLGGTARASGLTRLSKWFRHKMRRNDRAGAQKNILAHYDLGNDFYRCWLDETMSYSCALFAEPINDEDTLEAAQERKIAALINRLRLKSESTVLEIGCGWGHFAKSCADLGHSVTSITLSPSQKLWADDQAVGHVHPPVYSLCDYRDATGSYDAIASIEMVEAVGQEHWPDYLDVIARLLKPGGRAAIQYITIADDIFERYAASADFIQTYIFPGGMLISESRLRSLAAARGLRWEEPVHFGLHYAETLRRWHIRFDNAAASGQLPSGFDVNFVKLWRFYLMYCEGGFRSGGINVTQVTLVKEL
jgi:cyclopropane-fatty-acyl-phospholipid synthase